MKIWFTAEGKKTIKAITSICRQPSHRVLVVAGCNRVNPLLDYLRRNCGNLGRVDEVEHIEDLTALGSVDGDHFIILHSLVNRSVREPVAYLETYCRRRQYKLIYAPFSLKRDDMEALFRCELDVGKLLDEIPTGNMWALNIAHETALQLSMGILNCYDEIRENFIAQYRQHPDQLSDAKQCMQDYLAGQAQRPDAEQVRLNMHGNGGIERLIRNPDDDDWLVLWSVGLAGKYNETWQLSPFLLESPGMYREMQFRLQRAVHSTLTPVYQAWVHYCEKTYSLREQDDNNEPIQWYPISVLGALTQMLDEEHPDVKMCRKVRALRNWVQHDEGEDQEGHLRDYLQTREIVLKTCASVIAKLYPDGNLRNPRR